jgi:hypothetical protein
MPVGGGGVQGVEGGYRCRQNLKPVFHSRLKQWLRPFHGVATKKLAHCLGWRRTIEAFAHIAEAGRWLAGAMGTGAYQQTTL